MKHVRILCRNILRLGVGGLGHSSFAKYIAVRSLKSMEVPVEELLQMVQRMTEVKERIAAAAASVEGSNVRLIAVSKMKPSSCIRALYDAGHRDFGENYVQELIEKAAELPADINWHFIGHLQSGKAKSLVRDVPSLESVETVDSDKVASKLNAAVEQAGRQPLTVYIQVDTSNEDTKSGVSPAEVVSLADYIIASCPHLSLKGLMTIGAPGDASCFDVLRSCRLALAQHLEKPEDYFELSMGMSADFEAAIAHGATSVRVGSTIFGARDYSNTAK